MQTSNDRLDISAFFGIILISAIGENKAKNQERWDMKEKIH